MDGYTGSIFLDIAMVSLGAFIYLRWGDWMADRFFTWITTFWDWYCDKAWRFQNWMIGITGVGRFVDWLTGDSREAE